jgi:sodium-dependent dicarboxylate transporter 2/3/5
MAALGAAVAPGPWPAGPAELAIERHGATHVEAVRVGETAPIEITHGDLTVTFPAGIPVNKQVEARVRVVEAGKAVNPGHDGARLALVLPDGRREHIPLVRWDGKAEHMVAQRRPPMRVALALALLGLVVILWVTEALPLYVTALLVPVVISVAGAQPAEQALAPFFHPIIALFLGGALMAETMHRVGLDRRIAMALVARAGRSPATLMAALMGMAAFMSFWMSNTAATALMVPIALATTAPLAQPGFRKSVVLGLAYAATIGGVGSPVGTPANPLAIEFLGTFAGRQITFVEWFGFGVPMVVMFLPIMGAYLWWMMGVRIAPAEFQAARDVARDELARMGRISRDQWLVLAVFVVTIIGWLTQSLHGANNGIIALGGALLLALVGQLGAQDVNRVSWSSLLTFGGGLALGAFLVESGTSDWIATTLGVLASLPPVVGLVAVALLTLALTAVASNTATAAMLIPLAIPLASVLGGDPTQFVIVIAIASAIDFALVVGTPPTMIAYATELFSAREIFRVGIVLDCIGITLLLTVVAWLWRLFGLV